MTPVGRGDCRFTDDGQRTIDDPHQIAFWVVLALFLGAACTLLGFPILSDWLASLAGYLPRVLAAAAIVLLGILSGLLLRVTVAAAAASAGFLYSRALSRAASLRWWPWPSWWLSKSWASKSLFLCSWWDFLAERKTFLHGFQRSPMPLADPMKQRLLSAYL